MIRATILALLLTGCATQLLPDDSGVKDGGVKDQAAAVDMPGAVDLARNCVSSCNRCQGVCCGTACCNAGEWCGPDGACHCGSGAACMAPEFCATGGPVIGQNACGSTCCGGAGNPCPL